jgi:hypothetical protein
MGQCLYIRESANQTIVPVLTATAVNIGDICGLSAAGNAFPAKDTVWNTDLATTQTDFVALLLGHSYQYKAALSDQVYGANQPNTLGVSSTGVYEADCASTTFKVGDYVGMAKDTGNALVSQTVASVPTLARAIGVVVEAGSSLTRVKFRLLSTKLPLAR